MKEYITRSDWSWIIVWTYKWYKDLLTNIVIKDFSDIKVEEHKNDYAIMSLNILKDKWLEYIIAWTSKDEIVIHNHWKKIISKDWKQYYTSWGYRIKKLRYPKSFEVDIMARKFNRYTAFGWDIFYNLLVFVMETSEFVLEKDVVMNPGFSWGSGNSIKFTEKEKMFANQAVMYSQEILTLMKQMFNWFDETQQYKYDRFVDKGINMSKACNITEAMEEDKPATLQKLCSIAKDNWVSNYITVINLF